MAIKSKPRLIITGFKSHREIEEYIQWHRQLELREIEWTCRDDDNYDMVARANLPINKSADVSDSGYQ